MTNKDFFAALADLEKEKGIPQQVFLDALENALVSACKKQYTGSIGAVEIKTNPEKGTIDFFTVKTAVEEVIDRENEISLFRKIFRGLPRRPQNRSYCRNCTKPKEKPR